MKKREAKIAFQKSVNDRFRSFTSRKISFPRGSPPQQQRKLRGFRAEENLFTSAAVSHRKTEAGKNILASSAIKLFLKKKNKKNFL